MGLNNLFTRTKGETPFFHTYIKQAETSVVASKYLQELVNTEDIEERKHISRLIKKQEVAGDELIHDFYIELGEAFVTPFDREDMNDIAMSLDTFLDFLNRSAKTIIMYEPEKIDDHIKDIIDALVEDSNLLVELFKLVENLKKNAANITEICRKIVHIEHEVDNIFGDYIIYLFSNVKDGIQLLKYKEIAQVVEDATDRCKDVSSTVMCGLLKQS